MILEIIEKHKTIIQSFEIQKFKSVLNIYKIALNRYYIKVIKDHLY